jgi:GcrA cell cycle regulator
MGGPNNVTWTPAQDELCKAWLAAGFSRSQVAVKLNDEFQTRFTRCAVGGRAWRLKFQSPERPKLGRKPRVQKYVPRPAKLAAPKPAEIMQCEEMVSMRLTLLELQADECRWPEGDGTGYPGHTFCGHQVIEGSSYCLGHEALSKRARW